ncbi:hypothetical protein BO70DRAFT_378729 [Aspergillus heteromorphus CBS 117.55]|uniref:RING-type domain-containing protein n=1 Tax=Aspergillus heteromorphus CBS 117.55 TaxID=1448321 RepID=A0A317WLX8_9EURO|nr:uncharacterized protein BO70DRAFT_378729 [Aspergillus heteromorphus CBS 117.55]PWY86057.1 hypothetical protein BO70DRAFT_378729 [Aspergillus heteromorphus CBS 117.55]
MVEVSSAALLGYLAPVCVAFVFFGAWVFVSARRRRRFFRYQYDDVEAARHPVILQRVVEERFPTVKYKVWLEGRGSKGVVKMKWREDMRWRLSWRVRRERRMVEVSAIGPRIGTPVSAGAGAGAGAGPSHGVPTSTAAAESTTPPSPNQNNSTNHAQNPPSPKPTTSPSPSPSPETNTNTDTDTDTENICSICIDPFSAEDDIRELTCGHIFHASCLDPWLTRRRACCPMCKMGVSGARVIRCQFARLSVPEAVLIRGDLYSRAAF